ncbi:MAG: DNA internalization-related competence protein ComEC/Rec2 [Legionellales bacterium]|nr:DNA internalization-related competence protein ComEC/Rec2 [Legionellales bacterium]
MALPSGLAFWLGTLMLHQCSMVPGIGILLGLSGLLLGCCAIVYCSGHRSYLLLAALLAGFIWAQIWVQQRMSWELPYLEQRQDVAVVGRIISVPERRSGGWRFVFRLHEFKRQPVTVDVLLNWYGSDLPPLRAGDDWQLTVRLTRPHGLANPGGFDREKWLLQQGIRATGYVRHQAPRQHLNNNYWQRPITRLRQWIAMRIEHGLGEKDFIGFIQALVLGLRDRITSVQWQALSVTGTTHLMAISGLHISLVAGLGFWLSQWGWRRYASGCLYIPAPRLAAMVGIGLATLYAALAGFSIPTQRALIMVIVLMLAHSGMRQLPLTQGLGLALWAVLLYDPLASLAVGFYLSFAAVGLIFYAVMVQPSKCARRWLQVLRLQGWVAVGLLPFTLYFFHQTPWLSFVANVWAIPWVSFVVVPLSLLGSLLVSWVDGGQWLLHWAHASVWVWWQGIEWLADESWAQWPGVPPPWWGCLMMGCGLLILGLPKGWSWRWLGWFWILPVLAWPTPQIAHNQAVVNVLDVGQGLAVVVRTQNHALLFDTGPRWGSTNDAGKTVILPFLRHHGIRRLDRVFLSHGHADHVGGFRSILQGIEVGDIWASEPEQFTGVAMRRCLAGQQWQWDGITFKVLYPDRTDYSPGNDNSCVLHVSNQRWSVLLTGDIEQAAERRLLAVAMDALAADVMIAPHHASRTSSGSAFIAAVNPQYVLLPLGYLNRFGFPHKEVLRRYQKQGAKWLASGYHGALTVVLSDQASLLPPSAYRLQRARYWYNRAQIALNDQISKH